MSTYVDDPHIPPLSLFFFFLFNLAHRGGSSRANPHRSITGGHIPTPQRARCRSVLFLSPVSALHTCRTGLGSLMARGPGEGRSRPCDLGHGWLGPTPGRDRRLPRQAYSSFPNPGFLTQKLSPSMPAPAHRSCCLVWRRQWGNGEIGCAWGSSPLITLQATWRCGPWRPSA